MKGRTKLTVDRTAEACGSSPGSSSERRSEVHGRAALATGRLQTLECVAHAALLLGLLLKFSQ